MVATVRAAELKALKESQSVSKLKGRIKMLETRLEALEKAVINLEMRNAEKIGEVREESQSLKPVKAKKQKSKSLGSLSEVDRTKSS